MPVFSPTSVNLYSVGWMVPARPSVRPSASVVEAFLNSSPPSVRRPCPRLNDRRRTALARSSAAVSRPELSLHFARFWASFAPRSTDEQSTTTIGWVSSEVHQTFAIATAVQNIKFRTAISPLINSLLALPFELESPDPKRFLRTLPARAR